MGEEPPLACLKVYMSGVLWGLKGDAPDQFGCHEDAHLLEGGDGTRGAPRSKTPVYRLAELKNVRPYREIQPQTHPAEWGSTERGSRVRKAQHAD